MTAPEDQNGLREALARAEAEALERADVEAELMAGIPHNPAPPPIPVRGPYFLIECEHCGWVGSSEQGGTFCGDWGDSDVYCPVCNQTMLCDGPNEADTAKHGQAVFDRITSAEAQVKQVAKERDGCAQLAGASVIAERDAARRHSSIIEKHADETHQIYVEAVELRRAAEAEITRLKEGMEAAVGAAYHAISAMQTGGPTQRAFQEGYRAAPSEFAHLPSYAQGNSARITLAKIFSPKEHPHG
jgi:hypothetical protein